ncbi:hypothetical protein BRC90_10795 [Halobacteriales archaeon QS_4_69_34]|nr:MAG: hypothetical protein BRC90_10795 [Halobacteriales archaeon QS_4_69_34]
MWNLDTGVRIFDFNQGGDLPSTVEYSRQDIENESTLEDWLHTNPEVLLDEPLFVFGRQYSVETGIPDLLALDQYGNVVVFELKKGESGTGSASEETIMSQPQNYSQSLHAYSYSQLNDIYQTYRDYIKDGQWKVSESAIPAEDLQDAHTQVFGTTLKPTEFNLEQRIVIVAEEISSQTQRNAQYLLDQGLNIQCVEIQYFTSGLSDEPVLATSMPVDYGLSRVRPSRHSNPVYENENRRIAEYASPEIQEITETNSLSEAFPTGFDLRQPKLESQHPDHPTAVLYSIRVKPEGEQGRIRISIDIHNDEEALETIRGRMREFEKRDFISSGLDKNRVIYDEWSIDGTESMKNNEILEEIADRYVELVELGHEVFSEHNHGSSVVETSQS